VRNQESKATENNRTELLEQRLYSYHLITAVEMKTSIAGLAALLICRSAAQMADPALEQNHVHVTVTVPPTDNEDESAAAAAEALKALEMGAIKEVERIIEGNIERAIEGVILKEIDHISDISPEALEEVVQGAVKKQIANIKEMNVYEGTVNIHDYTPDDDDEVEGTGETENETEVAPEDLVESGSENESVVTAADDKPLTFSPTTPPTTQEEYENRIQFLTGNSASSKFANGAISIAMAAFFGVLFG
jgi:hypothetical protein